MKNKKAAMEMSVGTIVTIVLLMTVLILGLVLVRSIFSGAIENIDGIDQAVKSEINKLFAEDDSRKIVVYPSSRKIIIKKGTDNLGFGFAIRNVLQQEEKFSYNVVAVESNCDMRLTEAEDLIALGKERKNINLPAGSIMDSPIFVRFSIPDTAPPCNIRYEVQLFNQGQTSYAPPVDVDLEIKSS
jgi:hypothetical protein